MEENRNELTGEKKSLAYRIIHNSIFVLALTSIIDDFIVESLSRHDPVAAAQFMIQHPLVSICNCMLIIAVLSL